MTATVVERGWPPAGIGSNRAYHERVIVPPLRPLTGAYVRSVASPPGHFRLESLMRVTRRPPTVFAWALVPLLITAVVPAAASAQTAPLRTWAVVPLLGFGVLRDPGSWRSAGVETAVDLEYGGAGWRWSGYASLRGLGASCSETCFTGGPAVAAGGSRYLGAVWIGAGAGMMKQFGQWRLLPYGRISLDAAPLRFELRVEVPQHTGSGVYIPFLVGIPISR